MPRQSVKACLGVFVRIWEGFLPSPCPQKSCFPSFPPFPTHAASFAASDEGSRFPSLISLLSSLPLSAFPFHRSNDRRIAFDSWRTLRFGIVFVKCAVVCRSENTQRGGFDRGISRPFFHTSHTSLCVFLSFVNNPCHTSRIFGRFVKKTGKLLTRRTVGL